MSTVNLSPKTDRQEKNKMVASKLNIVKTVYLDENNKLYVSKDIEKILLLKSKVLDKVGEDSYKNWMFGYELSITKSKKNEQAYKKGKDPMVVVMWISFVKEVVPITTFDFLMILAPSFFNEVETNAIRKGEEELYSLSRIQGDLVRIDRSKKIYIAKRLCEMAKIEALGKVVLVVRDFGIELWNPIIRKKVPPKIRNFFKYFPLKYL